MNGRPAIATALVLSVGIHAVLLVAVPAYRWRLPVRPWERLAVQLVPTEEPTPAEPEPVEPPEPQPPVPLDAGGAAAAASIVAARLARAEAPLPSPPPVRPPPMRFAPPEPETIPWVAPIRPQLPESRIEGSAKVSLPIPPGPAPEAMVGAVEKILAEVQAPDVPESSPPEDLAPLRIEWQEGVQRRLVRAPALPELDIRNEAEVRVRFWVSPRGDVTQAPVVRRGDPDLDAAALSYVRQLRFNPLPPGDEREQWGTITLRFLLE